MKRNSSRWHRWTAGTLPLVLAAAIMLSGCAGGGNAADLDQSGRTNTNAASGVIESNQAEADEEAAVNAQAEPAESDESSDSLLPEEIPPYDGAEQVTELDGEPYEGAFSRHPFHPYGFYIPEGEGVRKEDYEDGSEWWMGERSIFTLLEDGQVLPDYNYTNPELADYAEYVGSVNDREVIYEDFFAIEDRGRKWIVRFSYRAEEAAQVLPVFLGMLKSIRYAEQ